VHAGALLFPDVLVSSSPEGLSSMEDSARNSTDKVYWSLHLSLSVKRTALMASVAAARYRTSVSPGLVLHWKSFLLRQPFIILKNANDLSADFSKKCPSPASLPLSA
ncbi:hypothetical protein Tco_0056125, partial [Tanacetum coccineum]